MGHYALHHELGGFGGGEGEGVAGDGGGGGGGFFQLGGGVFLVYDFGGGGAAVIGDVLGWRVGWGEDFGDFEGGDAPRAGEELHWL